MKIFYILLFSTLALSLQAQQNLKPQLQSIPANQGSPHQMEDLRLDQPPTTAIPPGTRPLGQISYDFAGRPQLVLPATAGQPLQALLDPESGQPLYIKGKAAIPPLNLPGRSSLEIQAYTYLEAAKSLLHCQDPLTEFTLIAVGKDDKGNHHIRLQQQYQGLPIYGAILSLHTRNGEVAMLTGRSYPTPTLRNLDPSLSKETAIEQGWAFLQARTAVKTLPEWEQHLLPGPAASAKLVVFFPEKTTQPPHLAWELSLAPNLAEHWSLMIDAQNGAVLQAMDEICKIQGHYHYGHAISPISNPVMKRSTFLPPPPDGPATAVANDLFGQPRTIDTYEKSGLFYLIDAAKSMHNSAQSSFPNDPVGVIWTINAQNTSPQNNNFSAVHITSNNNSWNNPTAVSAHYNAGIAYKYYENTHSRSSINGQGGNIVSLINVADENGGNMDNAFWNGAAMFYGNGGQAFSAPLAKALDVTGHELTHGVIQSTANLEYYGESGAINESMADVFATMIDRSDWKIGEDIVNTAYYPTGALRDLSNPHNGGNSLNTPGWQPDNVSEQYLGGEDNAGVHINSGIPNKAFQLFATAVGKDKAEKVYYSALTNYLGRSSQFIDLRIAVIAAAQDLYSTSEANAAATAFNAVGIGAGQGGSYQQDYSANPGEEFILYTDENYSVLNIVTPEGQDIATPLSTIGPLSKPSISDDGNVIVYVANDKTLRYIVINWGQGTFSSGSLSSNPIWRNAAISKDGNRLAALTDDYDNFLYIFDLTEASPQPVEYELYNPTSAQGIETGDVQYPDVLEWEHSGQWVMYDALNRIENNFGGIEYWDISFVRVWNNNTQNFSDGLVSKLFTSLPEDISVGNPSFAKNSPYIIAFDLINTFTNENRIMATNLETGDVGSIFDQNILGYPNYSVQDDQIIFDAFDNSGNRVIGLADLANDKINSVGNAVILISDNAGARWGGWFANGFRPWVDTKEPILGNGLKVYPNPFADQIQVDMEVESAQTVMLEVFDMNGRMLHRSQESWSAGNNHAVLNLPGLPAGAYLLRVRLEQEVRTARLVH